MASIRTAIGSGCATARAVGVGMLVSGWFMRSQSTIPGLINIAAGATFTLCGAYLAVRHGKPK